MIQVNISDIPYGGLCDVDSWFGSVHVCVALKRRLSVKSTFIVNNISIFSQQTMYKIIKALHGEKVVGKWVVMETEISGV